MNRVSFEGKESIDSVIAEFPNNDDNPHKIPVKKLSQVFDSCVPKVENDDGGMKVFLRIRPIASTSESTIVVESENSILTNAPETSKRALYTKTESRHYVSHFDIQRHFQHLTVLFLSKFSRCSPVSLTFNRNKLKSSNIPSIQC
jgi:hypothetical protein